MLSMIEVFRAPFKADCFIYSVYVSESTMKLEKIPAMAYMDSNGIMAYRLAAPYFVGSLISTDQLENRYIGQYLKLNHGHVLYYSNKADAEEYAREIRHKVIQRKKAEMAQLRSDIGNFLKASIKFD